MNRQSIERILIFLGGFGVGAVVTYKLLDHKFRLLAEEEIQSVKEYARKNDIQKKGGEEEITMVYDNGMKQTTIFDSDDKVCVSWNDEDKEDLKTHDADLKKIPYLISMEAYNEEMYHFEKIGITFYEADHTFSADNDDIIDDISALVGDGYQYFGYLSDHPDLVYVRNYRLATDFELQKVEGSYQEIVLGNYGKGVFEDEIYDYSDIKNNNPLDDDYHPKDENDEDEQDDEDEEEIEEWI